jgi:hypothetical protein
VVEVHCIGSRNQAETRLGGRKDIWFGEVEFRAWDRGQMSVSGTAELKTFFEIIITSLRWEISRSLVSRANVEPGRKTTLGMDWHWP